MPYVDQQQRAIQVGSGGGGFGGGSSERVGDR